jgi:hypothetical protein
MELGHGPSSHFFEADLKTCGSQHVQTHKTLELLCPAKPSWQPKPKQGVLLEIW